MSLLEETKLLLRTHRISPNKLLGQNFTIEPSIFHRLIEYADVKPDDVVFDVGAGLGFLTRLLAARCKQVIAVEVDAAIARILRERMRDVRNVEVIQADVLKLQDHSFSKIVSIPPYQISSKLLTWLLPKSFDCAVLVFQREFANKLVACKGSDDYGWLSILVYYYAEVELMDTIPKMIFYPQPKVDSVIVCLEPRKARPFSVKDDALFKRLVQSLFTNRNRKVKNAILPFLKGIRGVKRENATELVKSIPFRDKHVRELDPDDFGVIAHVVI
jgi:16S rRNA (adenine1518-N6/adenine1519-N6)-dimethyltransferase